ncbi:MAG: hypothetical protein OQJ99_04920 [Rhodospirillales bacterium]|nr:hypothetical protein [Rhodospirillales bacterium]MCW8861675.1 hypothetical protein [Rhodospirillales bacterium]MCW8951613.1 hypothetical protein [Rhodospirillales bacterium]MCW9003052.1 hypothetical protein [Rhodospirillales bacterium]
MRSLTRAGVEWQCFMTNDGVRLLYDETFVAALDGSGRTVVCKHSWGKVGGTDEDCPVEIGSQTNNSAMMANAVRLISL